MTLNKRLQLSSERETTYREHEFHSEIMRICNKVLGQRDCYHASYASTVLAVIMCLSVRLYVRHKSELYKDG